VCNVSCDGWKSEYPFSVNPYYSEYSKIDESGNSYESGKVSSSLKPSLSGSGSNLGLSGDSPMVLFATIHVALAGVEIQKCGRAVVSWQCKRVGKGREREKTTCSGRYQQDDYYSDWAEIRSKNLISTRFVRDWPGQSFHSSKLGQGSPHIYPES